jgi:hypothetical protein
MNFDNAYVPEEDVDMKDETTESHPSEKKSVEEPTVSANRKSDIQIKIGKINLSPKSAISE